MRLLSEKVEAFFFFVFLWLPPCSLPGQPGAVNNLPAVASNTELMGLMSHAINALTKSCLNLTEGKGIYVFITTHSLVFSRVITRNKTINWANNGYSLFFWNNHTYMFFYSILFINIHLKLRNCGFDWQQIKVISCSTGTHIQSAKLQLAVPLLIFHYSKMVYSPIQALIKYIPVVLDYYMGPFASRRIHTEWIIE